MEWIRKRKKLLIFSTIVFLILSLCAMFYVKALSQTSVELWHLYLLLTPWLLTVICLFPLVYLAWFGSGKWRYAGWAKLLFWVCIPMTIVLWIMIYAVFILQITFMKTL